jgi:alpha-beta hydrolase superfamily lysophospholipase
MLHLLLAALFAAVPTSDAKQSVDLGSTTLEVFTYKPADYKDGPLIVSFHGVKRNAESYRDSAKPLADQLHGFVIAPYFDTKRFPTSVYQRGNVLDKSGKANAPEQWTYALVPKLIDKIRKDEGKPDLPYYLIGHSAGGQFLVRLTYFQPLAAQRIIAANPGSELFPTTDLPFPYGLAGLPPELRDETRLKQFFAAPFTLFLGTADIVRDENFDTNPSADLQGTTRLQRGHNLFNLAQKLAKEKGWPFHWRLVEAPGVAHSANKMFSAPAAITTFKP